MSPEIADIHFNADRLSKVKKAANYTNHVSRMYYEIQALENQVRRLQQELNTQNADPEARQALQEVMGVLQKHGIGTQVYVGPSATQQVGGL